MPMPFSSEGSRRVRAYAANGVSTTESPVRNAAFEAVVSVWPRTWSDMPAARSRPSRGRRAGGPAPRGGRTTSKPEDAVARRNRQKRNPQRWGNLEHVLDHDERGCPRPPSRPTRTASASKRRARYSEGSDIRVSR